jgi:Trypsin-like peptidase domain
MPDEARNLVVRIDAYLEGLNLPTFGAGIVIAAATTNELYVVTAKHVVEGGARFDVSFAFSPDSVYPGRVLWTSQDRDIAVLSVAPSQADVATVEKSFTRLGNPRALVPRSQVYPVGCPSGDCWLQPTADQMTTPGPVVLEFQSAFVREGHSGGGLFDDTWELVGMITQGDLRRAEAIPVDFLLNEVRRMASLSPAEWDRMSTLRAPAVPRRGYGLTLGASVLLPLGQPDILPPGGGNPLNSLLGSRFPSLRVTLEGRTGEGRSWHLAGMRLTPDNVTITGLFAGVALEARSGRMLLRPFAEVGGARVQTRFDTGGYMSGSTYVPIWDRAERDGLGLGGGVTAELAVFSNTILEVTGGAWSFGLPENAPDVPHFYVGGGLRLGW